MQTYTHAAVGAAIGALFFRHNYLAQAACVAASVGPDVVMIPVYMLDKLRGKKPLEVQGSALMTLKEMSHSLILCTLAAALPLVVSEFWRPVFYAFAVGWLAHLVIDVFTHGKGSRELRPEYWDTDVKFMWPTRLDARPLGAWEYRYDFGVLKPKPFELLFLCTCVVLAYWGWFGK